MIKSVILSVDWDNFVPEVEKPEHHLTRDWGHNETPLFHDFIWKTRANHLDLQPTSEALTFWDDLPLPLASPMRVLVSDSHSHALPWAQRRESPFSLVLVDAHHDLRETAWKLDGSEEFVDCGNWASFLVEAYPFMPMYWNQAEWSKGNVADVPARYKDRIFQGMWPRDGEITDIHICRSGCWTPPWLDSQFIDFVRRCPAWPFVEIAREKPSWNPMMQRWTAEDLEEAVAFTEQIGSSGKDIELMRKEVTCDNLAKRAGSCRPTSSRLTGVEDPGSSH